jgi:hypothetical protein
MKFNIKILFLITVLIQSCWSDKGAPNYEYMPNMYRSIPYDTYGEYDNFVDGNSALLPPNGTIARGYSLFEFENNTAGYELAKKELKSPFTSSKEVDLKTGKELYNIYCAVCHGNKGAGQGILVKREKILGIPSYSDVGRAINEGSIYHSIFSLVLNHFSMFSALVCVFISFFFSILCH